MAPSQNISLEGKVAFISGASKGIGGAQYPEAFSNAGADLALTARNAEELEQTAESARKSGSKVWTQTAEMADTQEVKSLAEDTLKHFGRVDILVNNAGVTIPKPILEAEIENFHTIINVNVLAPLLLTQAFAPGMIEQGHGKIINISSRAAIRAFPTGGIYSASKSALQLLTQTMAVEFGPHNVQGKLHRSYGNNDPYGRECLASEPSKRCET
ncbi:MAG: hypothetical protein Ct9H300mP19_02330 [Dehalococcoidia bacterium]|nr:MAG: hypothetical protein Ct9H300mP19_02330 [Dehalococcoidia bacterium]